MPMDAMCAGSNLPIQSFLIPMAIALGVILLRSRQARRLRVELLWIRPAIFMVLLGASLYADAPILTTTSLVILGVGLVLGCGLGWQRGRLMQIHVNPETHELSAQPSVLGLVLIVALMAVRFGLRGVLCQYAQTWHLPLVAISDAFTLFIVAVFVTQGLEMWLRAGRLLTEARAAKGGLA